MTIIVNVESNGGGPSYIGVRGIYGGYRENPKQKGFKDLQI
jgi:hypothetical protein